jgi:ribosomal protein S18 acetylase RimI-like enzyme
LDPAQIGAQQMLRSVPLEGGWPMTITLRSATAADADFLWTMLYYAAQMDREVDRTPADAQRDPYLRVYVADWGLPTDLGLIACDGETPIGAVWSRIIAHDHGGSDPSPPHPELAAALLPAYQGQGIGARLLQAFLAQAAERFPAVVLTVRADNPALRLYQRAGFTIAGTLTNRVGTESYAMICEFTKLGG